MRNKKYWAGLWILTALIVYYAYGSSRDRRLEYALQFAADNRPQLEKVLLHYQNDPEKLEAARFLIRNMPRYYAYEGAPLDTMKSIRTRLSKGGVVTSAEREQWDRYPYRNLSKIYDATRITAAYLIENIDLAFEVWKYKPWNRSLSFDDFCEYILPYRVENSGPLDRWRSVYHARYSTLLDSLYQGSDVVRACSLLTVVLYKEGFNYNTDMHQPNLGAHYLLYNRVGTCRETSDLTCYALRAAGIPVATDRYLYSPQYEDGYAWNVVRDTTGHFIPFCFLDPGVVRGAKCDRKMGKVFRDCFGIQPEETPGLTIDPSTAPYFRNRFKSDVTADYFGPNSLRVPLEAASHEKFAYLGIFSIRGYIPVAVSRISRNEARFENLEPDVIFQPLYTNGPDQRPAGYPFLFDGTKACFFVPDTTRLLHVTLMRKYPLRRSMDQAIGCTVDGALRADFGDARLLHTVTDTLQTNYDTIPCPAGNRWRYIRFGAPQDKCAFVAEIACYVRAGGEKLPVTVSGSKPHRNDPRYAFSQATDGDPLSYYKSERKGGFLIVDLLQPVSLHHIVYAPYNDGNFIRPGDRYELLYQGGTRGWVSLGEKTARIPQLDFDQVPAGALLWLRNLTRGGEEQVFYYQDGRQCFPPGCQP